MLELQNIKSELPAKLAELAEVGGIFDLDACKSKIEDMEKATLAEGFWDKPDKAQNLLKEKKRLENRISEFQRIEDGFNEVEDLIEIAIELEEEGSVKDIERQYNTLCEEMENLKMSTLLNGKYDGNDAILSIHAGTGGVDAMDWAEMLERMYLRYCERKGFKTKILDLQDDTAAGIKSCTIQIQGENAFGMLKSEQGVHRLVRISPFNSMGKRQTSFAAVDVVPEMDGLEVEINPNDLKIDTYRSSGAGGQSVNTTDSAVRITHLPTGIVVTCQNERSQIRNREVAMKILASKLMQIAEQEHKDNLNELRGDMNMATWGSQIRNYVFQPYTMVKDTRTGAEVTNVESVMDGNIDIFIRAKLSQDASV
ncbi:MAG: peptide chain release factor 2 [Firmicutes bacterium]|nr:peptide chain release factor 2 [Bacillota bacterium]